MACFASGISTSLWYVEEVSGAIPATPEWKPLRFVSESLSRNTNQVESEEIRANRQRPTARQGTYSTQGEVVGEMAFAAHDDLLQAALQGAWDDDEIDIGTTRRTFAVLERHSDVSLDYVYRGCEVASMAMNLALNQKARLTFGLIGKEAEALASLPAGSTFASPTTSEPMVTTTMVISEGGSPLATATELAMMLNNGMEAHFALGRRATYCISNGYATVSGTLSAYLHNGNLQAKYFEETFTSLSVTLSEAGDSYTFSLPRLLYTQGSKSVAGNGPIIPQLTFSAGIDANDQTLIVTRDAA